MLSSKINLLTVHMQFLLRFDQFSKTHEYNWILAKLLIKRFLNIPTSLLMYLSMVILEDTNST